MLKSINKFFEKQWFAAIILYFGLMVGVAWAADAKLSALVELASAPAEADELYINDGGVSKKITVLNLLNILKAAITSMAIHDDNIPDTISLTNIAQVADVSATASEINTPLDGATVTLAEFQQLQTIGAITISAAQWTAIGGLAATLTFTELNYVDGVTSAIQTQLDAKESSTSNNIDPDRLAGDTTDDNLIDPDILGPFGAVAVTGAPASDDTYGGMTITGRNCGEAIAQWDLVYVDDTAAEWMVADADAAGKFPAVGIMVAACTDGNAGIVLIQGVVRNDGWTWTGEGKKLYLGDGGTGSTLVETAPATTTDCVQLKAYTMDDDHILIIPSLTYTIQE